MALAASVLVTTLLLVALGLYLSPKWRAHYFASSRARPSLSTRRVTRSMDRASGGEPEAEDTEDEAPPSEEEGAGAKKKSPGARSSPGAGAGTASARERRKKA